jgi:hypothetical protein
MMKFKIFVFSVCFLAFCWGLFFFYGRYLEQQEARRTGTSLSKSGMKSDLPPLFPPAPEEPDKPKPPLIRIISIEGDKK